MKIDFTSSVGQLVRRCPLWLFWIAVTLLYSIVFTTIDFADNPFSGVKGFLTLFAQGCVVAFATAGVIGLMSINKIVFAICYPALIVASAVLSYYHLTLGIALSAADIELMVVNDFSIWATLISLELVIISVLALLLSLTVVIYRWRHVYVRRSYIYILLTLFIIATPTYFVHRFYDAVSHRMPYCFYYAFKDYLKNRKEISKDRHTFDSMTVGISGDLPDVVLILGESLRADHLGLNGYHRQTTPRLQKDTAVVSYPYVSTRFCGTHQNIPYILTRADSVHEDRAYTEESFIPLFEKAGYSTYWISNQDKNPAYAYFMSETDSVRLVSPGWTTHNFMEARDEDMLPYISRFLNNKRNKSPKLLIIHTMGSHWVYNLNHSEAYSVYKPEVDSRVLSELSTEQLNNSYDNTILATDDFIARVINLLRHRNAILIYLSDHGENLGEDGMYLHNSQSKYVFNPACMFWYSQMYYNVYPDKVKALKSNSPQSRRNDMLFHTVIDAAGLKVNVLDTTLSVVSMTAEK